MLNSHRKLDWSEVKRVLVRYCYRMKKAGHTWAFRKEVLEKGMCRVFKLIEGEREGSRRLYRSRDERERYWTECGGRPTSSSWFKKLGYGALLQVPAAGGEELANIIKGELKKTIKPKGIKTMVQEDGGISIRNQMVMSDPLGKNKCPRSNCPIL